jgi:uncharacterized membrane protein (UPF0127 family)
MKKTLGCLAVSLFALALAGCAKGDGTAEKTVPSAAAKIATAAEAKGADAWFPLTVGGRELRVQVVVTQDEQARGLMGRRDLGADDGMVFVYPFPQQMSFWMRNTPTPLDIGFFRPDGTLGEVYPMYPFDETPVRSAAADYTLALEVNQGWFAKHGIRPGATIDHAQLAAALRARGFSPRRYAVREE